MSLFSCRASYTVTRDGKLKDVNRRDEFSKNGQNSFTTDPSPVTPAGHHRVLSAHACRDVGQIKAGCDTKVLPKPSQLRPRQQKRKRKLDKPVVLDHLAQLRRKQHGFTTGQFGHHGKFFTGAPASHDLVREDGDEQAVPCSPNLKKIKSSDSIYDMMDGSTNLEDDKNHYECDSMVFGTPHVHDDRDRGTSPYGAPAVSFFSEYDPHSSGHVGVHEDCSGPGCSDCEPHCTFTNVVGDCTTTVHQPRCSYTDLQEDCTINSTEYGDVFPPEQGTPSGTYIDFMVPQSHQQGVRAPHNGSGVGIINSTPRNGVVHDIQALNPQTQVVWNNTSGTPILPAVRMNRLALDPDVEDSQFRLSDGVFATARRSCNSEEGPLIPWEE